MATHSSILAWRISWTEEPGGLQSMVSHRVRRDRGDSTHTQGENGQRSLVPEVREISEIE